MNIAVIGGGASGMMAALAARAQGAQVTIFERQARVGRKLLATGNGRCNLTNLSPLPPHYHGEDPGFSAQVFSAFPREATLEYFRSLGLVTLAEPSGRVYPYSDQANSVVDVLRFAMDQRKVALLTGVEVRRIRKTSQGFSLKLAEGEMAFDRVVVACGGAAGGKLGGTMSGYQLLRSLGHKCTRLRPSLVQIRSGYPRLSSLKGIRAQCRAEIFRDDRLFAAGTGEIQFTDLGLSGPVIFGISRNVCAEKGDWECRLDLLPQFSREAVADLLRCRRDSLPDLPTEDLFTGLLHNRLGRVLAQEAGLRLSEPLHTLSESQLTRAAETAKTFSLSLTEPLGMDAAQVTAGGILTRDFDPGTLESRLVPGLYACGEVLDVDGDCGGYNLQWAWSSGYAAGTAAGKEPL